MAFPGLSNSRSKRYSCPLMSLSPTPLEQRNSSAMTNKTIGCCDTFLDSISQLYEQTAWPFSGPSENTAVPVVLIGLAAADSSTTGTVMVNRSSWPTASGARLNASPSVRAEQSLMGPHPQLLDRTRRRGEHVVGIGANQSNGTDDKHKDHGEHHRIFRDVLPVLLNPESVKTCNHVPPPGISLCGHPRSAVRAMDEETE